MAKYIDVEPLIKDGWMLQRYNSGDGYAIQEHASIKDIPPADVRPVVRGRWIKLYENPLDGSFYCSNCKKEIDIADGYITPLDLGMYYCHNCGADMREEETNG